MVIMEEARALEIARRISAERGLPEPERFGWEDRHVVLPAEERRNGLLRPKVWLFESSGDAYDASQCADAIRDGDVLMVPPEGSAAVLWKAWPTLRNVEGLTDFITDGNGGTYTAFGVFIPGHGWEDEEYRGWGVSGGVAEELMREMAEDPSLEEDPEEGPGGDYPYLTPGEPTPEHLRDGIHG